MNSWENLTIGKDYFWADAEYNLFKEISVWRLKNYLAGREIMFRTLWTRKAEGPSLGQAWKNPYKVLREMEL